MITKEKKVEIVEGLKHLFKGAKSVVFVHFNRFSVEDTNQFRTGLRDAGVGYTVARKTLLKRALEGQKYEGSAPELLGQIGVAYGDDPLAPAREVWNFGKTHGEAVEIVGGIYEGMYKGAEEMQTLATIPGMEGLRGMFANVINSPLQRFALVLNEYAGTKS